MKYLTCRNPSIKALVALKAIKGESVTELSMKYHVNRTEIAIWKRQLLQELYVEDWMVNFFKKQPYFIERKNIGDIEPY